MYVSKAGDRSNVQKPISASASTPVMTASARSGARAVGLAATAEGLGEGEAEGDAAGAGVAAGAELGDGDTDALQALTRSATSAASGMDRCFVNVGQRTVTLKACTELLP